MITVHLADLSFYAFHGVEDGESKLGSKYAVDIKVTYEEGNDALDDISNVVNYAEVYDIVKKRMAIPSPLLEEVAEAIIIKIRHQYKQVSAISVSIYKLQPPIPHSEGKVGITLHKRFEE